MGPQYKPRPGQSYKAWIAELAAEAVPQAIAHIRGAKVIYLVDAEKAQELLSAQRAAERKP
jgi:hypothetical protein